MSARLAGTRGPSGTASTTEEFPPRVWVDEARIWEQNPGVPAPGFLSGPNDPEPLLFRKDEWLLWFMCVNQVTAAEAYQQWNARIALLTVKEDQ